jgi:hypothetical protein
MKEIMNITNKNLINLGAIIYILKFNKRKEMEYDKIENLNDVESKLRNLILKINNVKYNKRNKKHPNTLRKLEMIKNKYHIKNINMKILISKKKKNFLIVEKLRYISFLKRIKNRINIESDGIINNKIKSYSKENYVECNNLKSEIIRLKKERNDFMDDPERELNEKEKKVIENFSKFHNIDPKDVKLSKIYKTSAGFNGWLKVNL